MDANGSDDEKLEPKGLPPNGSLPPPLKGSPAEAKGSLEDV